MHCGTKLPDTARFCQKCGEKTTPLEEQAPSQRKQITSVDDILSDKGLMERIAGEAVKKPGLTAYVLLNPLEKSAKNGPVTWDTIKEAKDILTSARQRRDPSLERYEQVLQPYLDAEEAQTTMLVRWSMEEKTGDNARGDWKLFLHNDLETLCIQKGGLDRKVFERLKSNPGILRFLDGEFLILLFAAHMFRGRFEEISTDELVVLELSHGYPSGLVPQIMKFASGLAEKMRETIPNE